MESKKTVILDLTDCKYLGELHERIRVAFDWPEWYGANWSAFWDLLWSECDADEVSIQGEYSLPKEFDKDIAKMHEILYRYQLERESEWLSIFLNGTVQTGAHFGIYCGANVMLIN